MTWAIVKRLLPYAAVVLAVLGVLWLAYDFGVSVERARQEVVISDMKRQAAEDTAEQLRQVTSAWAQNMDAARKIERQRIQAQQQNTQYFSDLLSKADDYAKTLPTIDTCSLGADGLRVWNAANTGPRGQ